MLIATDGSTFTLLDVLYVLGIKKNLLSIFALAKIGFVVKFVDDRCTFHDLSNGDSIITFGLLCCGLCKLDSYVIYVENLSFAIVNSKAILDAKLWHAHFGHLNFPSLRCL